MNTKMSNVQEICTDPEITLGGSPAVKPDKTADQRTIDDDPTAVFERNTSSTPASNSQNYDEFYLNHVPTAQQAF